ncbi:hypothetical protein [Microbacterium luteum]|uniref:hypothetical protein n=1 Tax=Microbacterium luteum TaxID=2782167 RepID=UPI001889033C|nr:hypothetical protein [Microbacterium luteum]
MGLPDRIDDLRPSQIALAEAEIKRQEDTLAAKATGLQTRAAVLIGASGVLGGTELVTASGIGWLSGISLAAYLLAAVFGLVAARSSVGEEPDVAALLDTYADGDDLSLRRSILLSRMTSYDGDSDHLKGAHAWLTRGLVALILAWTISGVGTVTGILTGEEDTDVTTVKIEGVVDVRPEP